MRRKLMFALVLPLLLAECVAQFVFDDQAWTTVFAVLSIGVLVVRWILGDPLPPVDWSADPQPDDHDDDESFIWEPGDLHEYDHLLRKEGE
jgi:hypothetical protein